MRRLGVAVALLATVWTGCKPRIEYVPVPCPDPPVLVRPQLPIKEWAPGRFTPEQVEKLLWQSLALEVGYSKALEEALASYRKKPSGTGQKLP